MNRELLLHIGMTENEAAVYGALLALGTVSVGELTKETALKRSNLYNILESLIGRGAAVKTEKKGVAYFQATDPESLRALAYRQEEQARHHRESLELALPSLQSLYQLANAKPSTHSFEGVAGVQRVYDDIIRTKKDILLMRSVYDNDLPELKKTVDAQIRRQVKNGIRTRVIAPFVPNTQYRFLHLDEKNLVERRMVPKEQFTLPAQVIVYGNKVAITALQDKDAIISTIIENVHIAETMRMMFEYMWAKSEGEHAAFRSALDAE